jgi:exodeoxyribonuclease VII large subunit
LSINHALRFDAIIHALLTALFAKGMLRIVSQLSFLGLEQTVWTVADLNRYLRQMLETDYRLQDLWVAGEVSNLSRPASGHVYFTLKDSKASLRCVAWRPDAARLHQSLEEGLAVEAHGHISIYESGGQYQLYVDDLRQAGEGLAYQEFLRLKAQLESEGLFAAERKRALPDWPKCIGVVTSPTGAALRDVLNILRRRFPLAEVILAPTPVQGDKAPTGIIESLDALNAHIKPDVILLVRGGGSIEDLRAFNDENVARAVASSKVPVVSGIGHETDFTITDFIADVRAPTPSAAAEIATPDGAQLFLQIKQRRLALSRSLREPLQSLRFSLEAQLTALMRVSPRALIINSRQRVDDLAHRATAASTRDFALRKEAFARLAQTLRAVGPTSVLARGYAIVQRVDDKTVVRSVSQASLGDGMDVRVSDGEFRVEVTRKGRSKQS